MSGHWRLGSSRADVKGRRWQAMWRQLRRGGVVAVTGAALLAAAGPASAHIPVVLNPGDTVAAEENSPLVPTGTTSFAFYGRTENPGDTQVVRVQLATGDQFHAELLIPDLPPETGLAEQALPQLNVQDPAGQSMLLDNGERTYFFEPFSQTAYLTLAQTTSAAQPGTYTLIVTGAAPSRFVMVTGQDEQRSAPIVNATAATIADVHAWYQTPPN